MQHDDTNTPDQDATFDLAHSDTSLARVVFGDPHDPLVELRLEQSVDTVLGHRIELNVEQHAAVSVLLSQVPGLIQSGQTALTQTYWLVFRPDAVGKMSSIMQAQGGGLHAIALDLQGKIVGQGILKPSNGVRTLGAATAIWQGMAMITAQVYLAQINERLAQIEQGINTIKAWLEADQLAKLEVGLRYVREARAALTQHSLSDAERTRLADQLEHIWRECGQVARATLLILQRAPSEFAAVELSAWYRLDESADLAGAALATYDRRSQAYLLATYVRAAIVPLRALLALNPGVSEVRLDELRGDIADWRDQRDAYFQTFKLRVHRDLSATFNSRLTIAAARRKLIGLARQTRLELKAMCDGIEQLTNNTRAQIRSASIAGGEPLSLTVTVDQHGQIIETYHMPISAQEPALNSTRGNA